VGPIVTPFLWAAATAYILNAIVRFLTHRVGGPRPLWVLIVYFGLVAAISWGLTAVVPVLFHQIRQLTDEVPTYVRQTESFLQANDIVIGPRRITAGQVSDAINGGLTAFLGGLQARAPELVRGIFEGLLHLLIYLVATFFMLLQADRVVRAVRSLFSNDMLAELDPWLRRINMTLGAYLRGQVLLIGIVTVATFIGLQVLGVHFALALAIMSGIVETVPYIGPYTAGAIATLVAMTQPAVNTFGWPPLMLGVAVAIMYTVIRQVEDNLIMPFVIGRTVELHPLTVLFVVLAGASLAGVLGLLIAVPVAATIKIIVEFLWQKIKAPDPRESLVINGATTWERLVRRIRTTPGRRLLLIVPSGVEAAVLCDVADYQRLALLAGEQGVELRVITNDPQAAERAHAAGIAVDEPPAEEFARSAVATAPEAPAGTAGLPPRPPRPGSVATASDRP